MKPIVVFVLAFVVATAGGTGAKVMMTKPVEKSASDSTKSDSTKTDSTKSESTAEHGESAPTDTAIVASGAAVKPVAETTPAASEVHASPAPVQQGALIQAPIAAPSLKLSPAAVAIADSAKRDALAASQAAASGAPVIPVVPDTAGRRVAKVFTSMDAKQAAKVLEHMSDGDVHIILGYVGVKQAAAIMSALPPERVATLSKLAMKAGGASK
jgi:hypothetical protein